jgi:predicted nucleic acid-binding protein
MTRVGVDANVVVSFITDRDLQQQARAAELFGAATEGECTVVLHQAVITEAVYVLCNQYEGEPHVVCAVMRDLSALPGVVTADEVVWEPVWSTWPGRFHDFGDACLTAAARAGTFEVLATFDVAFAKKARQQGVATYW